MEPTCILQLLYIFTVRKRSCGKENFVHNEGFLTDTPSQTHPRTPPVRHAPGLTHLLGRHPPPSDGQTPFLGRPPLPADGYCSGWYVSYWNAFLLEQNITFNGEGFCKRYYTSEAAVWGPRRSLIGTSES